MVDRFCFRLFPILLPRGVKTILFIFVLILPPILGDLKDSLVLAFFFNTIGKTMSKISKKLTRPLPLFDFFLLSFCSISTHCTRNNSLVLKVIESDLNNSMNLCVYKSFAGFIRRYLGRYLVGCDTKIALVVNFSNTKIY